MLTGLYFLAGLIGFVHICWWTYLNDKPGADGLPKLGLLAMKSPADETEANVYIGGPLWIPPPAYYPAPRYYYGGRGYGRGGYGYGRRW